MSAIITLEHGPYSMVVDANNGARIIEFSFKGKNALTTKGPQIGSTFWPSPQHSWGWPPPPALDSQPYEASAVEDGWVFTSQVCPLTHLVLSKSIRPSAKGFRVEYRMHNPSDKKLEYAPWEITRVDGGLTFYKAATAPLEISSLPVVALGNSFWFSYVPAGFDQNLKLFANNSDGWLANANNGLLLKKIFPQIAEGNIAPQEAEVEVYAHGDPKNPYIEIEQQGRYGEIAPGETAVWSVEWELSELPVGLAPTIGNAELLKLAEK